MRQLKKKVENIPQRTSLASAARLRPVLANGDANRKRVSDSSLEAVRILPNHTGVSEAAGFVFVNGKHFTPGRPRKSRVLESDGSREPIQPKERHSIAPTLVPRSTLFHWTSYLKEIGGSPAPVSYFSHVPLEIRNDCLSARSSAYMPLPSSFKPDQCMEGIDPHHESLFCVLKIAEVVGRRLRLRFIGYPEKYDFWTTVDSPFLFPVGWCAQNRRRLQPPKSYVDWGQAQFDWNTFLTKEKLSAVPRHLFRVPWECPPSEFPSHMFRIGHKLEAVDKRNPGIACVATVKDTIGDYVLIHFDGWDTGFDQWAHITSELLHPVGYCEDQELVLSIPSEWNSRPSGFTWKQYLKETNAKPVPKEAFERLSKLGSRAEGLQVGQRLEAVDKRCAQLIRVANVVATTPAGFLTLGYDGWPEKYNITIEANSPELFPVGYCSATGHPLQPPLGYDSDSELNGGPGGDAQSNSSTSSVNTGTCPTPGCKGYGHVKGPRHSSHQRSSGCPYTDANMKKDIIKPHERLTSSAIVSPTTPDSTCLTQMPKLEQPTPIRPDVPPVSLTGPCLSPDSSSVKTDIYSIPNTNSPVSLSFTLSTCNMHTIRSNNSLATNTVVSTVGTNGTVESVTSPILHTPLSPVPKSTPNVSVYSAQTISVPVESRITDTPLHTVPLDLSVFGSSKPPSNELKTSDNPLVRETKPLAVKHTMKHDADSEAVKSILKSTDSLIQLSSAQSMDLKTVNTMVFDPTSPIGTKFPDTLAQTIVTGSKRPMPDYPKHETKPRLPHIVNAANEYARQQQLFGLTALPVKRKRGRPRKCGILTVPSTPHVSRSVPTPSVPKPRNSMPSVPLYSHSAPIGAQVTNSATIAIPAVATSSIISGAPLSIYTPLTVGASLPGIYSAGLLLPSTATSANGSDQSQATQSSSPVTWNADSSSTVATSVSGPSSDTTEPAALSRSPNTPESVPPRIDSNAVSTPQSLSLNGDRCSSNQMYGPIPRGDLIGLPEFVSRGNGDAVYAATSQRLSDSSSFPCWPNNSANRPSLPTGLPTSLCMPSHIYLDTTRSSNTSMAEIFVPPVSATTLTDTQRADSDLMGRLVPQASAALHASKAAGLAGPHSWSVEMVGSFVSTIPGCKQFACKFTDNEIDGAALLCLEQHDLIQVLGMKLGPAVKIAGAIYTLRRGLMSTPLTELNPDYASAMAAATSCFHATHPAPRCTSVSDAASFGDAADKTPITTPMVDTNRPASLYCGSSLAQKVISGGDTVSPV